eukprot:4060285-Amphidinium_carterae.2
MGAFEGGQWAAGAAGGTVLAYQSRGKTPEIHNASEQVTVGKYRSRGGFSKHVVLTSLMPRWQKRAIAGGGSEETNSLKLFPILSELGFCAFSHELPTLSRSFSSTWLQEASQK